MMKAVQITDVYQAIRQLAGPYNLCSIEQVGKAKCWPPAQLLPCIDILRRQHLVSCSKADRVRHAPEYDTVDGCNLVSIRD